MTFFFLKWFRTFQGTQAIFTHWGFGVAIGKGQLCWQTSDLREIHAFSDDFEWTSRAQGESEKCRCNYVNNQNTKILKVVWYSMIE